jgi:hypothetical protein
MATMDNTKSNSKNIGYKKLKLSLTGADVLYKNKKHQQACGRGQATHDKGSKKVGSPGGGLVVRQ